MIDVGVRRCRVVWAREKGFCVCCFCELGVVWFVVGDSLALWVFGCV